MINFDHCLQVSSWSLHRHLTSANFSNPSLAAQQNQNKEPLGRETSPKEGVQACDNEKKRRRESAAKETTKALNEAVVDLDSVQQDIEKSQKKRKKPRWSEERKETARKEREAAMQEVGKRKKLSEDAAPGGTTSNADDTQQQQQQEEKRKKRTKQEENEDTQHHPIPNACQEMEDSMNEETNSTVFDKDKKIKEKENKNHKIEKILPEDKISGPSNAAEAHRIRCALGYEINNDVVRDHASHFDGNASQTTKVSTERSNGFNEFAFGFVATENIESDSKPSNNNKKKKKKKKPKQQVSLSSDSDSDSSSNSSASSSSSGSSTGTSSQTSDTRDDEDDASSGDDTPALKSLGHEAKLQGKFTTPSTDVVRANHTDANVASALQEEEEDPYVPRRVYIGGMPYSYTEEQVREFWEYCGPIESIDMLTFPDTGRFRGIAFITFLTDEGFRSALACDGETCEEQTVKVKRCNRPAHERKQTWSREPSKEAYRHNHVSNDPKIASDSIEKLKGRARNTNLQGKPAPKVAGYLCAYVGNIAWEADEEVVRQLFEKFGATKVRLHTDKITGKPKGYAHVHFRYDVVIGVNVLDVVCACMGAIGMEHSCCFLQVLNSDEISSLRMCDF